MTSTYVSFSYPRGKVLANDNQSVFGVGNGLVSPVEIFYHPENRDRVKDDVGIRVDVLTCHYKVGQLFCRVLELGTQGPISEVGVLYLSSTSPVVFLHDLAPQEKSLGEVYHGRLLGVFFHSFSY